MALYTDYVEMNTTETDAKAINHAIRNILFTRIGSMPGKPTFGSNIHKVLFAPIDHITKNLMKRYIKEALAIWEDRIIVMDVTIEEVPEYNKLIANIEYKYRDAGLDVNAQISLSLLN